MIQYKLILNDILYGPLVLEKDTRTGIKTKSISGVQFEHDMRDGFPLLTTKKMSIKNIAVELEFFIKGLNDKKWLQERGCHIWDEWANPKKAEKLKWDLIHMSDRFNLLDPEFQQKEAQKSTMDLGRIYGVQWRDWKSCVKKTSGLKEYSIDQLALIIDRAKANPLDRRLIVSAWRPDEITQMALPPCHYAWQILSDGFYLDLIWVQRSVDIGLGLPYNIASYGLLLLLLAKELDLVPRRLVGQLGDTHIYENHEEKLVEQMGREAFPLPTVNILNFTNIFDWTYRDIELLNYQHHPKIELEIAV